MERLMIILYGNPTTKKNSQRIWIHPKTKKPFIKPSAQFERYEKECGYFLNRYSSFKIATPVNVKCIYYMETRRKVDLVNLLEGTDDMLVKYGVLEDDNSNIIVSHDGSRVRYDKDKPRVEIEITKSYID